MTEAASNQVTFDQMHVYLDTLRDRLPVFTVTDHPTDFPDFYVARLHLSLPQPQPMPLTIMDKNLERLQTTMQALGLVKLDRSPEDDPVILETWI